jgi:hypothetical protein
MRSSLVPQVLALCLLAAYLPAHAQSRASAEAVDMDEKDRALVAKEGLKQKRDSQGGKGGKKGSNSQCGQVDIGNDSSSKKGSAAIADRQKTVIITGNVINTANCK